MSESPEPALRAVLDAATERVDWQAFKTRLDAGLAGIRPRSSAAGLVGAVGGCAVTVVLAVTILDRSAIVTWTPLVEPPRTSAAKCASVEREREVRELIAQLPPAPPDVPILCGRTE